MSKFAVLLITFYTCIASLQWMPTSAANILAVETVPGKSHWNVMRSVLRALTNSGHTVTVFTPFVDGDREGYSEVDVSNLTKPIVEVDSTSLIEMTSSKRHMLAIMSNVTRADCDTIHEHPQMTAILNRTVTSRIDLVVTEPLMSECVAYVATMLRVPIVYVVPAPIATFLERPMTGHVPNPAVTGHVMSDRVVPKTFVERFANIVLTVYCSMVTWYNELQLQWTAPRLYDAVELAKPSIIFTNTHFITEPARPLTPDVVQIGGIHLTPPKPIPKDILEFIEDAPHGVIYFTFGSVVSMSTLPENVQSAFREALAQVPQKVLWKYEGHMKDKPKNVMTRKWFPQRDILSHPNVKLFISHGGISGVYEAVDAGVPVLGFPVFYDQPRNIDSLVNAGMAICMDLLSVTKETFLNAVLDIVNNDRYQKNAKSVSERFKDRPMSPAESVVYWTEYVLRHNGAPHLKSHALNMTWYQYFLVDVIITFLFLIFVVLFITYYCLKIIYKYIFNYFQIVKAKRYFRIHRRRTSWSDLLQFGSVISMSKLPENVQSAFREALAQVPQKVLWKYEGHMKDKPKNVMTRKWFPQRDILFMEVSGVYEAVDAGVPVLGFPVFYDQPRNIDSLVNAGMAICMDLLSVTKETFLSAVLEIVNNDSYQKNAKIASERFKDRSMSPAESFFLKVYWTEYVLRHNGAPHLKSQALNFTWYQYYLVDVIITFLSFCS